MSYRSIDQYALESTGRRRRGADEQPSDGGKKIKRHSIKQTIKRTILLLIVLVLLVGGWLGYTFYQNAAKITGNHNPLQLFSMFLPTQLKETNGRVNILLAGDSAHVQGGHPGAELTDSIMEISYDPSTKSAVLISIPRDTWVHIPGNGYHKINAVYEYGQSENFSQAGYASGGMGLLEEVIYQDYGIHSNYDALIDWSALKDAVNAVGGVTVDIKSPDPRGLYDPYTHLKLPNGPVTLNGQQALDLARARGDGPGSYGFPQSDFNRTQHQQQLLVALKTKATSAGVISNPIKVAKLTNALGNNVKTDLSLREMYTFYRDTKGVGRQQIKEVTLNNLNGQDYFQNYYAPNGEEALIPAAGFNNFRQIQAAIQSLLG